jgi:hypothetical protein
MLFLFAAWLLWNPFNWWSRDEKDWETKQEVDAIDGLVQDEQTFEEMDQLGQIPETPWGETDEHEAVDPTPPEDKGPPRWMRWLGL